MIKIYTDGAYNHKNKVGGWAAIIVDEHEKEKVIKGSVKNTTNNRMELLAVLQGLFTLSKPSKVKIFTDSKYVEDALNKGWLHRWVENEEFDRPNFDLWRILYNLEDIHDIQIEWVKGHSGHIYNERCDKLATQEVEKAAQDKKFYAVAVGRNVGIFDTWQECNKQVFKFKNAKFKKFDNEEAARKFIERNKIS